MASTSDSEEVKQLPPLRESNDLLGLHELFKIVGDQMTTKDVRSLKFLYKRFMPVPVYSKVNDGFSFLLALERLGRLDETNFKYLLQVLRIITRHDLSQYVSLRRRKPVALDPVDEYLQRSSALACDAIDSKNLLTLPPKIKSVKSHEQSVSSGERPAKRPRFGHIHSIRRTRSQAQESNAASDNQQEDFGTSTMCLENSSESDEIKKKVTCDIRLRVRAEYCDHDSALEGNIFSNKADLFERRIEKFMQANTILKSRDLGSIICDIKFSELTYLDAFWRDYINGSLLEALKGVFITESLKQAVGHEAIKLLVNVDEDDYEAGRVKLLQNLIE